MNVSWTVVFVCMSIACFILETTERVSMKFGIEVICTGSWTNIVRVIKSRRMTWARHVACMGEGRGVYRVLVGRPEGKRPLGRPRHR